MGLSAQDRLDIQDLYARACHYLDFCEPDKYVALYTEDGVFARRAGEEIVFRRAGTAELKAFADGVVQRNRRTGQHWLANIIIDETPEGARGTAHTMMVITDVAARSHQITLTGQYHDRFVRTASGWRFKERMVVGPW